jgi:hypothetical protein
LADILLQKPTGILAMMVNTLQFSLGKFIVGGVGNRIAHHGRRIMDILNCRSFPQQFNESRSVRFFHTYLARILRHLALEIRHFPAAPSKVEGCQASPLAAATYPKDKFEIILKVPQPSLEEPGSQLSV